MGSNIKCKNENCGKLHDGTFGSGKFCNRSCANSRSWSELDKLKKSKSALNSKKVIEENKSRTKEKVKKICKLCETEFRVHQSHSHRQYCSKSCFRNDPDAFKDKNLGGYRRGSGRGKSGWYNEIWCDSTYELVWVIYNLDHNIEFKRNKQPFPYKWKGEVKNYYPDFEVKNQLVEIKGYMTPKVEAKIKSVPGLKVLFRSDLETEFNYVYDNYTDDLVSLYDVAEDEVD